MGRLDIPAGAVDSHVHVFDPWRFPFAPDASYRPTPPECGTADDLSRVLEAHGVARAVVVTPSAGYGYDNACMLDAVNRLGARARGIARVPVDIAPRELDELASRGIVGVRVDFVALGIAPLSDPAFPRLLAALAERDLLLDVQAEGEQWSAIVPAIRSVPVRAVIDHMGRPRPEAGIDTPAFEAMLGLAATGRVAVKLSGADRYSRSAPPHDDAAPFAAAIVREFTCDRLVWGSDWPFVRSARRMDYGPSLDALAAIVPDARDRDRVLRVTPARWFRFDA